MHRTCTLSRHGAFVQEVTEDSGIAVLRIPRREYEGHRSLPQVLMQALQKRSAYLDGNLRRSADIKKTLRTADAVGVFSTPFCFFSLKSRPSISSC